MTPDQVRECTHHELEILEEEAMRADIMRQMQAIQAAALGARSAWSQDGVNELQQEHQRLQALLTDPRS